MTAPSLPARLDPFAAAPCPPCSRTRNARRWASGLHRPSGQGQAARATPTCVYTAQGSPEFCDVAVGVTETSYVGVDVIKFNTGKSRADTCESTKAVAEQVLATIAGR